MKFTLVKGFCYTRKNSLFPKPSDISIRTETTGNFTTISFAQDDEGVMLQVPLTDNLKELLKGVIK